MGRIRKLFINCILYSSLLFIVIIALNIILGGRDDSPGHPDDKMNFGRLIRELRAAFDAIEGGNSLLLTAAVSAGKDTIDKAYPVKEMADVLNFIGIMTYDYHGWYLSFLKVDNPSS